MHLKSKNPPSKLKVAHLQKKNTIHQVPTHYKNPFKLHINHRAPKQPPTTPLTTTPLCEVIGLFRSSYLHVTISRVSISVFKGRHKRKFRPTFVFPQAHYVFCLYRPLKNSMCSLYTCTSQYLIESFTVRCSFSLKANNNLFRC